MQRVSHKQKAGKYLAYSGNVVQYMWLIKYLEQRRGRQDWKSRSGANCGRTDFFF